MIGLDSNNGRRGLFDHVRIRRAHSVYYNRGWRVLFRHERAARFAKKACFASRYNDNAEIKVAIKNLLLNIDISPNNLF